NENMLVGILVALAIGIVAGAVNGFFIAYLKLPALVITLAVSNIIQGIINVYTAGAKIDGQPSPVLVTLFAKMNGVFPNIIYPLTVIAVIAMIIIYKTKWGQKLLAVGSNETTAYLCGIDVKRVRFTAYVISGTFAAFTGVALLAYMNMAFKDMGSTYVMPSIAAVVVGGVSMAGGDGNYIGVILGAIVLQTLTNLFYALGLGEAGKWVGIGVVLLAVLIAYVREKKKR
ncbi:MAG: ABC transporter permease, partial [Lachnospiraceae bacterium]|nr:ABC transporter permease [Lachnospiraceae bacterium]